MATDSTVKILMLGCLRSGCNCAADILSLDWVEMDLKNSIEVQNLEVLYLSLSVKFILTALVRFNVQLLKYTFCPFKKK